MEYKQLKEDEICRQLFESFNRHQKVTKCWRRAEDKWIIREAPFTDNWTEEEYKELVQNLKNTVRTGGIVYGAFSNGALKGFTSIESEFMGTKQEYLDLSNIHVSEDMRGKGIGKKLFELAVLLAKAQGAGKLYISAHSAVESQAFYKAMGCVEALEYNQAHVKKEPYDCQLEYVL